MAEVHIGSQGAFYMWAKAHGLNTSFEEFNKRLHQYNVRQAEARRRLEKKGML